MKKNDLESQKKQSSTPEYFSKCFHRMREEQDLTQGELADCLGISRQSVNAIEKGKSLPSIDLALNIADFFHKSLDEFFRIEEEIEDNISGLRGETSKSDLVSLKSSHDVVALREAIDQLFEDSFVSGSSLPPVKISGGFPAVDMYETGKDVVVEIHIPGYDEKDIGIEIDNKAIYVSGEKRQTKEEKDKNYYQKEVSYNKFSRTLMFPVSVKSNKAKAKFTDGVLRIVAPKEKQKKAKIIRVEINKK